jgi:hypothetical protein
MNDDLSTLRQSLNDLSEHGGSADLYDRTLRTSRRLGRHRALASGAAVAAAVLAVAVPVGLAGLREPVTPSVATAPSAAPSAPATTAARPDPPSPSAAPSQPSAAVSQPSASSSRGSSRKPSSPPDRPSYPACPSAATLARVAELSDGWTFERGGVECWRDWATAAPVAPSPELQGDGIHLFRYDSARGRWKQHSEGSGYSCTDLGIPKTQDKPHFCDWF